MLKLQQIDQGIVCVRESKIVFKNIKVYVCIDNIYL